MIGLWVLSSHCMQANCKIFTSLTTHLSFPQSSPLDHSHAVKHFHLRSTFHLCGGGAGRKKRWPGRSQACGQCWIWPYIATIDSETHSSSRDALLICTHCGWGWGRGKLSFVFACIIEKSWRYSAVYERKIICYQYSNTLRIKTQTFLTFIVVNFSLQLR